MQVIWITTNTIPTSGGQLQAFGATFDFLAGTFTETVVVTHTVLSEGDLPALPPALVSVVTPYSLTATFSSSSLPAQPAPGQTYSVIVAYTDMEKGAAIESTLALYPGTAASG